MIGQVNLQSRVDRLLHEFNTFPNFSIFVGPRGSGKKTFLKENFDGIYLEDNRVDSIRKMIDMVYKVKNKIFIMTDTDTMSSSAQNALLKVVEECPNDNKFILTLEDENNILETIRSRGTVFYMDRYTPDEIREYCVGKGENEWVVDSIITDLCETPGDVDLLLKMNTKEFYDYVQLVADNIAEVSLANAFKIPSKVALKDDAEGYDLKLFWKAFMKIAFDMGRYNGIYTTARYLQKLRIRGVNKQMLLDSWILEIRELWA